MVMDSHRLQNVKVIIFCATNCSDMWQPQARSCAREKYHLPSKSGAMAQKITSTPKLKTIHCSFLLSAPKCDRYPLKGRRSPISLFSLICIVIVARTILRHPEPMLPKLTIICCLKKLQTPNSSSQFAAEAIVPFAFTIELSLQAIPPNSMYSWKNQNNSLN